MSECEEKEENRIQVYPAPAGALLQADYLLRVWPVGAKEWQRVKSLSEANIRVGEYAEGVELV